MWSQDHGPLLLEPSAAFPFFREKSRLPRLPYKVCEVLLCPHLQLSSQHYSDVSSSSVLPTHSFRSFLHPLCRYPRLSISLLCECLPICFVSNEHPLSSYCIPGNMLIPVHVYSGLLFPHDTRKCHHIISAWNARKYGLRGVSLLGQGCTGRHTLGRELIYLHVHVPVSRALFVSLLLADFLLLCRISIYSTPKHYATLCLECHLLGATCPP